jgi:hypothetical protein
MNRVKSEPQPLDTSRLSFNRADAYTRVMETDDAASLREVAAACVKSGVALQAIDRLGSPDRRHAYEAFSLVSLLAKADVLEPIIAAIMNHPNMDVRLGALRLLGTIGQPGILQELRELVGEPMPQPVSIALVETIAQLGVARCEDRQNTEAASVALQPPSATVDGGHDQDIADSSEILWDLHEEDDPGYLPDPGELADGVLDLDPFQFAGAEEYEQNRPQSLPAQDKSCSAERSAIPEQNELQKTDSVPQETRSSFLGRVSEQPPVDTSGLPALPIA